jgi:hypothetical protein
MLSGRMPGGTGRERAALPVVGAIVTRSVSEGTRGRFGVLLRARRFAPRTGRAEMAAEVALGVPAYVPVAFLEKMAGPACGKRWGRDARGGVRSCLCASASRRWRRQRRRFRYSRTKRQNAGSTAGILEKSSSDDQLTSNGPRLVFWKSAILWANWRVGWLGLGPLNLRP